MQLSYSKTPKSRTVPLISTAKTIVFLSFLRRRLFIVSLALLSVQLSFAQTIPASPNFPIKPFLDQDGLRRQEERTREQQQLLQAKSDVLTRPQTTNVVTTLPIESPCFSISEVQFTGASAWRFSWLQASVQPFLYHCAGVQGLRLIASTLDAKLIELGYATTRVSLPQQNLRDGKLVFALQVGRVSELRMIKSGITGDVLDTAWGTWWNAFPVSKGNILNIRDLEQGVEQMKRLSSQSVATRIEPGQEPDTSIVFIERQVGPAQDRLHGGVTIDNSGSSTLGRTQLSGYLAMENLLGLNDILNFGVNSNLEHPSSDHHSRGYSASYSIPWGFHNFSYSQSSNQFAQIVQGTTVRFLSSGNSDSKDFKWNFLALRTASSKAGVFAGITTRHAESFLDDVELVVQRRRTTNFEAGINFKQLLGQGSIEFDLGHRQGMPWRDAQDDFAGAADGGLTLRPQLTTLHLSLNQAFQLGARNYQYLGALQGQHTSDKTLAIDQISIGGRSSVRGFDGDSVLLSESGLILRNEVSTFTPFFDGIDSSSYLALDFGQVGGASVGNLIGNKLAGIAAGVRIKSKALQVDMSLGTPLYHPEGFQTLRWNPYLSLTYAY
jgi:hemolysin activation/secretion protein